MEAGCIQILHNFNICLDCTNNRTAEMMSFVLNFEMYDDSKAVICVI